MKILDKTIQLGLYVLNKWHLKRIEKHDLEIPNNEDNYEALIPNTKDKKKTSYGNPFIVALKTPNVNNIAITGSYGSGKSSFLRRFEKDYPQWNYLPISLATFSDTKNNEQDKDKEGSENTLEMVQSSSLHQDIERSILQQFFYREKDKTIPFSRFKKIKKVSKIDIFLLTISIPYLYVYIFRPKVVQNLLPDGLIEFTHEYNYIFLGLAVLLFLVDSYRILYFLGSFQISKFDIKKNSITVAQQDKASILNEHLDEILYFFEATKYDVVIFEDIDRFENTEIFVKLRELNNLINNSKQVNRRVVFVYAIRDDMFVDKERTKFFDFIVPIIPYINPSNSEQKLIDKFKKEIDDNSLNEKFLTQMSWYIDDMRLLINIYNEYMIYKNNLNSASLDHNKLLALIICKNFYPLAFAKLHIREGEIYQLFTNKPQYIKNKLTQYENNKSKHLEEIKLIRNENIKSLEELKIIYLGRLFAETNADLMIINDSNQKTFNDLFATDILDEMTSDTECSIYKKEGDFNYQIKVKQSGQKKFGEIEDLIDPKKSYLERKKLVENKSSTKIDDIKKEIEEIDKNINKLKNLSLKELFVIASETIVTKSYEDKDLLIFLVRNGYIDEYYEHYISYFHEGGITQDDREFLLSIQNHKPLGFSAMLGNIAKLIEKLDEKDFKNKYILNNQLTSYFLNESETKKKENYFNQISNSSDKSVEFIFQYMEYANDDEKKLFIKQLTWDGLWAYIYKEFSTKEQNKYFKLLFNTLDLDKLVELNMSAYLAKQTVLPKYVDEDNKKCEELIDRLNILFVYIENPSDNPPLFSYIYENRHYKFSPRMIEVIMREKGNIEASKIDELNYKNLTIIRGSEATKLIDTIDENLAEYWSDVLYELNENKQESEDTLLYLLNHEDSDDESSEHVIQKIETKVIDITLVKNKELWVTLLAENKIYPNWDNLLHYYQNIEEAEIDDVLVSYLNIEDNYIELSKSKINNEIIFDKSEILKPFNKKLILSSGLNDKAYSYLIKSIWLTNYKTLSVGGLSKSKIESILSTDILSLTQENIINLKENFSPLHITLIEKNKDEFINDINSFEFDTYDILKIVNSTKFITEEKFKIIESIDLSFFDDEKELKEKVSKLFIDANKPIEDIGLFDKLYYGDNKYDLELLISRIHSFEECESIKPYLKTLEEYDKSYTKLIDIDRSKLYLEDTTENRLLLQKLVSEGCISSWKENIKTNNLKVERKGK